MEVERLAAAAGDGLVASAGEDEDEEAWRRRSSSDLISGHLTLSSLFLNRPLLIS